MLQHDADTVLSETPSTTVPSRARPIRRDAPPRVAVIGAGVTGVTTAYELSRAGCDVTVFDRRADVALETSYANGGQLSASNAEVWNRLGTLAKGLRWMMTRGAPLSLSLAPSWHKYGWLAEFALAVRNYERNTVQTAAMAIAAREHLLRTAEHEGIDFDLERRGILHIYESADELAHARRVTALLSKAGLDRREVGPGEIASLEPALHGAFCGGFYTPSDMSGDVHKFTVGLAKAARRRGVRFVHACEVTRLTAETNAVSVRWRDADAASTHAPPSQDERRFDGLVMCAGVGSRRLAAQLGDRVNVYPVKGYSITVGLNAAPDRRAAPWMSLLDDAAKVVTSRLGDDRLRIAGTAEFAGENTTIREVRVAPLLAWCRARFPGLDLSDVTAWAGLRPMLPNMMPRVGRGRSPGVYYNTGHGHLGWTLAAGTAHAVAQCVTADLLGQRSR